MLGSFDMAAPSVKRKAKGEANYVPEESQIQAGTAALAKKIFCNERRAFVTREKFSLGKIVLDHHGFLILPEDSAQRV